MTTTFLQRGLATIALASMVFVGAGCKPAQPQPTAAVFSKAYTFGVGDTFFYTDGLRVTLESIDDSRCKPDVQCIWQGELAPTFTLSGADIGVAQTLRMGTERTKEQEVGKYHFALGATTETSATLTVIKNSEVTTISDDKIRVTSLKFNDKVTSPLTVTGSARGTWYFEASFPVKLLDANGKVLAAVPAQAQGEWMTENFVPFSATLTFAKPTTATGTLVFEKDNPSGLPEHDDSRSIPVKF